MVSGKSFELSTIIEIFAYSKYSEGTESRHKLIISIKVTEVGMCLWVPMFPISGTTNQNCHDS